jgi:hypothetical protein
MATRKVPSQYATISAAITAATSGDAIVIAGGTYSEHLNLSAKTNILVRAELNETVIINCVLSSDAAVSLSSSTDITLRNLNFVLTGTTMGSIAQGTTVASPKFIECTFDTSAVTGSDVADAHIFLSAVVSTASNPVVVSRCTFAGPGSSITADAAISITGNGALYCLTESCLFRKVVTSGGSTDATIKLSATSGGSVVVARNNTLVDCRLYSRGIYVNLSTSSGTALIYNNLIDESIVTVPSTSNPVVGITSSGGTLRIRHNRYYHGTTGTVLTTDEAYASAYSDSANCLVNSDPAVDITTGRISLTSPAYRAGASTISTERAARLGLDRLPFYSTPSQGCYEPSSGVHALHVKHAFTNPTSGFTLTHGLSVSISGTTREFADPFELSKYIELLVQDAKHNICPFEFWYQTGPSHRYRATVYQGTFSLTTSGIAGTIMGSAVHSSVSDTG